MMVHLKEAVECDHTKIVLRIVDSDVIPIAVCTLARIEKKFELWIAFGTGKNYRYILYFKFDRYLSVYNFMIFA